MVRAFAHWSVVVLMLAVGSGMAQDATPPEFELVQGFVAAMSAGDAEAALAFWASGGLVGGYWLHWGDVSVRDAESLRVTGEQMVTWVRWEVTLVGVYGGGRAVVTRDRFLAEWGQWFGLTTLWTIDGGQLAGAVSVVDSGPTLDGVAEHSLQGVWQRDVEGDLEFLALERASFAFAPDHAGVLETPSDVGTFWYTRGALTLSSGPQSELCAAGDRLRVHVRYVDDDTLEVRLLDEACGGRWSMEEPVRYRRVAEP